MPMYSIESKCFCALFAERSCQRPVTQRWISARYCRWARTWARSRCRSSSTSRCPSCNASPSTWSTPSFSSRRPSSPVPSHGYKWVILLEFIVPYYSYHFLNDFFYNTFIVNEWEGWKNLTAINSVYDSINYIYKILKSLCISWQN